MFKVIWMRILALFGKKETIPSNDIEANEKYALEYESTNDINFTAIFSNKLTKTALSDATIDVIGNDKRTDFQREVLKRLQKKLKKVVSRELGTGGVLVIPYVARNKIYFDIVAQNRMNINKRLGEDIIDCTIMAEHKKVGNKNYYRWNDYVLNGTNLEIRYRATVDADPINIKEVEEWKDIQDMTIPNVEKMLFMYLKSPVDNRKETDEYGVPITYGCEKQIRQIKDTLNQIIREYDLKEAFVGADESMFKGEGALPTNGLYRRVNSGEDGFWEVFSPEIRDTSLFNKLMNQCALLEKQIGTSRGILTERESTNATATEIKASMKDTFDIVDDIREGLEDGLEDFLYACDVLANFYNLVPAGKYELKTDWDYSLIEDSAATFSQYIQGVTNGVIKKEELRQFIKPDETLEEAKKAIEEIKKENPTTEDLLGN